MDTRGRHLILECRGCDPTILNDQAVLAQVLRQAALAAGATVLGIHLHEFTPQGVAGVAVLAESHLSIHTWPEAGYAAVDLYTCGHLQPELAKDVMASSLGATRVEWRVIDRGLKGSMRVSGSRFSPEALTTGWTGCVAPDVQA